MTLSLSSPEFLIQKQDRKRDEKHRRFVASLPCCVTGLEGSTQCAHITAGRFSAGMKASDEMCVPLSIEEHDIQTKWPLGEIDYWSYHGGIKKAKKLAMDLYKHSGNLEAALLLVEEFRNDH